jgi:hypothetical protein
VQIRGLYTRYSEDAHEGDMGEDRDKNDDATGGIVWPPHEVSMHFLINYILVVKLKTKAAGCC